MTLEVQDTRFRRWTFAATVEPDGTTLLTMTALSPSRKYSVVNATITLTPEQAVWFASGLTLPPALQGDLTPCDTK